MTFEATGVRVTAERRDARCADHWPHDIHSMHANCVNMLHGDQVLQRGAPELHRHSVLSLVLRCTQISQVRVYTMRVLIPSQRGHGKTRQDARTGSYSLAFVTYRLRYCVQVGRGECVRPQRPTIPIWLHDSHQASSDASGARAWPIKDAAHPLRACPPSIRPFEVHIPCADSTRGASSEMWPAPLHSPLLHAAEWSSKAPPPPQMISLSFSTASSKR